MSVSFEDIKKLYLKKSQEKLMEDQANNAKIRQDLLNQIYEKLNKEVEPLKELRFDFVAYNEASIYKNHFLHLGLKVREDHYHDDHDSNYDRYCLIVSGWA
jgi:hypothetical protein